MTVSPGFAHWAGVTPYRADHTFTRCFVVMRVPEYIPVVLMDGEVGVALSGLGYLFIRISPGFTPWAGVTPHRADHTFTRCFVAMRVPEYIPMVRMDGEVGVALSGLGCFSYVFPQGLHPGLVSPLSGLTTPLQGVSLRCGSLNTFLWC
jgi:hypothetical protein